ncbi:hypothetical protein [Treponema denticola]|uniref:hypothetical protein n=1 Tax=Treponema denticola TaxID=158 RepID=UPI0002B52B88|nr:hypothetical protein [Treponema denticola]EMB19915.1 hypothetical protein HMPREF9724_02507 [Treponema denticola SP37]EPF33303.1 hypothetical protein HMPREF9734_01902 [Treponema denticola SP44]EPF40142.1 hypothetical protein HMPREF9731_00754 [Treponema denticola SP23]
MKGENINAIINGSQFLHGDGNDGADNKLKILISKGNAPQPAPYSLTFGASDFSHDNNFVGSSSLLTLDGSPIPSEVSAAWVIRYKTDIEVDTGEAVNYTIRLADRKGLQSDQITSGTQLPYPTIKLNRISDPTNYIDTGIYSTGSNIITDINKTNSLSSNPIQIYTAYKDEIKLEAFGSYGSEVEIKAKLNGTSVSDPSQISLTASEEGTVYTLELWAEGGGFPQSKKQTYHYKVFNTIKAQDPAVPVWGILKTAVTKRSAIKIDGTIKATDADNNKDQILILNDVNIVGKNNANLDANNKNRIFYVKRNALKLENIKLSNGYAEPGGAIYGDNSAHTYLKKVTIQSNTATTGKDFYLLGNSSLYMEDEIKFDSNNQIYIKRTNSGYAKFYLKKPNITTPIKIKYDDINFLKNKEVITSDNNYTLTEEDIGKFNLPNNSGFLINLKHEENKAVLSKIHQAPISDWDDLQHAIISASSGDTIKLNQNSIKAGSSTVPLKVRKNLTIIGTGSYTTLDADNKHRVFEMDESNIKLTLKNLIIKNGKIINDNGAGIYVPYGCQNSILTLVNTRVEHNTIEITSSVGTYSGAGIHIPNQNVKVFIIGGSISYNKIDCTGSTNSLGGTCAPQGCGLWLGIGSTTIIKGQTEIKNNSYIKAANPAITTKCYGVGIYIKGASTLTIGEAGAADNISPKISGHRKVGGTECYGTAIAIEKFNSYGPTVNWNSGQITNNGSQNLAVYNNGGTFNNNTNHTPD